VKELLKSVDICQSYRKNKSGTFYGHGVLKVLYSLLRSSGVPANSSDCSPNTRLPNLPCGIHDRGLPSCWWDTGITMARRTTARTTAHFIVVVMRWRICLIWLDLTVKKWSSDFTVVVWICLLQRQFRARLCKMQAYTTSCCCCSRCYSAAAPKNQPMSISVLYADLVTSST